MCMRQDTLKKNFLSPFCQWASEEGEAEDNLQVYEQNHPIKKWPMEWFSETFCGSSDSEDIHFNGAISKLLKKLSFDNMKT